jgi:prepilin-type N-terminal cleavage/methylation domain-containing protein
MRRDGFTLPEVMVVMVLLSIGILPLTMIQGRARQEVAEANRYTQAVTVAQRQLEFAKGVGFGNAAADSGLTGQVQWRRRIVDVSFGLQRIEVQVVFQQGSVPDTLQVASLISRR